MSKKLVKKDNSCRIIARQEKQKELLIEQLHKIPIIQISCEKLGIARSTLYRWRDEDSEFDDKVTSALNRGKRLINDMAESKLIAGIQNNNMTAIIYWLKHNNSNYRERKPQLAEDDIKPIKMLITTYDPKRHKNETTGSHHLYEPDDEEETKPKRLIRSNQE
jgi:hypothetical protein